jgi:signal peptidase
VDGYAIVVGRLPGVPWPRPLPRDLSVKPTLSLRRRVVLRAGPLMLNSAFVAMIASALIMLGPALLGFHRYVILTGSMTGTYDRGSVVFDRPVPVADLKVGDPITYSPPAGFTSQQRVTHRIWWIGRGADGRRVFRTKGDANKHPDAWTFTLNQATQDRVVFHIPEVGYVFTVLSIREFRVVLIGLPALIIAVMMLRALWREGGEQARRQKLAELGWKALADPGIETILPVLDAPDTNPQPVWVELPLAPVRPSPSPVPRSPVFGHTPARLHVGHLAPAHPEGPSGGVARSRGGLGQRRSAGATGTMQLRVARLHSSSRVSASRAGPSGAQSANRLPPRR